MDTSSDSVQNKTHSIFGCLKLVFRGRKRDKDTRLTAPNPSTSNITADPDAESGRANRENDISKTNDHDANGFWQMAYDELTKSDPKGVAILFPLTGTKPQDAGDARIREILDEVVKATEAQYRKKGGKDGIRATAEKILNSALSFQDVVSNIAKFDPTGYASSAWAIVSLGLTMAKNHTDRKGALFDSSGYLADLLARCAFIEEQFYGDRDPTLVNVENKRSIVRVYVAILRYSAEVRRVQQSNKGKDIAESVTAITSQPLTQLKTSIKEEEAHLYQWLVLDQHLRRKEDAEKILTCLDKLIVDIQKMRDTVDMLHLPVAKGAFFDSFEDQYEDECLPGTRTELLQQVQDWGRSSDKHLFWLSGMAGTGKSTIARTVSRAFKEDGILGASFFFKRGEGDRGSTAKFFSTIVKQLAVHIPQMVPGVRKALGEDPAIPGKSLREQFNKLMLQPLLAVKHGEAMDSTVIVIDALDECDREEDIEIILNLLPKVETTAKMAIRFFLTSRPEIPIRFGFDQIDRSKYQNTILQNLDENVIKHDIALYLRKEFSKIQQRRRHDLSPGWPGEKQIEALAIMACPLFIFAATVCRFVADRHFDPDKRLREFSTSSTGSKMDGTYRPVLNQLLVQDTTDRNELIKEFQRIIGVIILLANPLSLSSLAELLLDTPEHNSSIHLERRMHLEHQISTHLDLFHSVLSIPSDPELPIRALHLSFHDYLVNDCTKSEKATSRFWVDKREKHDFIACQCLAVMERYLRKNICNLPSYGTSRTEIDLDSIARFLPPALQYACRYWVYHLTQSLAPATSLDQVLPFLKDHFLHWLEAMGILGIISEAIIAVNSLLQLTKDKSSNEIHVFLLDARRFILKFTQIVDTAPLQLYSSGLIFAPHTALIRENFKRELPAWLFRGPKVEEYWNPEMQTLEGHSDSVRSVAFSGDGQLLASSSDDKTIKLWDPATGTLKHTLEGHSDSVYSVIFSDNSQLLISYSHDETIKLWDPTTGALKHTLEVDSDLVVSSGDGQLLASSSDNGTIQLWDPATSTLKHILEDHSDWVQDIIFSGDGQLLASSFHDGIIQLWDPITGTLKYTLESHSDTVLAIVFSGDSQLLASSSDDGTIKLWDPITGTLKHTLEGHSDSVYSVAFSGNGQLLASGDGGTIQLWDPITGALKHTLESHSGMVLAVVFSVDSQLLASSSSDKTIKLWDPTTGTLKNTLESHSSWINSVAFSGDGQLLASSSSDKTIKLWDPTTGTLKNTLESHSGWINSVAFSGDGQLLASSSSDKTIKLWDPTTSALKYTLEGYPGTILSVAFSDNSQLLISSSDNGIIQLWDPTTGTLKHILNGHSSWVREIIFSGDGQLLASGSDDRTIKLWDPITGTLKHTLEGHSHWVRSVAFSGNSQLLASGSNDRTIKLWDPITGTLKHTLEGHSNSVLAVVFSGDSQLLASSSDDKTIKLWDPATGTLKHTLEGHSDSVRSVAFSGDGQLLASSSDDKTIKLWDTATGTLKQNITTDSVVTNVEFSEHLPLLTTNIGSFDIQICYESFSSNSSKKVTEVSLEVDRWITLQGQRELWLPPNYQPRALTVKDSIIALGSTSGRVAIIAFSVM